jgi:hypothetical protein
MGSAHALDRDHPFGGPGSNSAMGSYTTKSLGVASIVWMRQPRVAISSGPMSEYLRD